MTTGYPTPDSPVGEMAYICKPIFLPDDEAFQACLYGQLSEMTNNWYWKETGTMTAQEAADFMATSMGFNDVDEECATMTCDEIIACIDTDPATQAALFSYLETQGFTNPNGSDTMTQPLSTATLANNLIPAGWTCDNDHAFGMSKAVINDIHAAALGVINAIEVATNIPELLAIFVDNVEVVSWFGSLLELGTWLQDEIIVNYEGAWSQTATQDALYCDLYCRILEDCTLSFDKLDEMYRSYLPSQPSDFLDLNVILDWAIDLDLTIDISTVAVWQWLGLQFLKFQSKFGLNFIMGYRSLDVSIQAAANDTDPDWIICPACPNDTYAYEIDFTNELGLWVVENGTFVSGTGIVSEIINGKEHSSVYIEYNTAYAPQRWQITYERTSAGAAEDDMRVIQWTDISLGTGRFDWYGANDTTTGIVVHCPSTLGSGAIRKQLSFFVRDNNAGNQIVIKSIKLFSTVDVTPPPPLINNSTPVC